MPIETITTVATPSTVPEGTKIAVDRLPGGVGDAQYIKLLAGQDGNADPIEGSAANGLEVDVTRVNGTVNVAPAAATMPVSGTVTVDGAVAVSGNVGVTGALPEGTNTVGSVQQAGIWTVQPGNTANTTAWKVDGSAVTQPVSLAVGQVAIPLWGHGAITSPIPGIATLMGTNARSTLPTVSSDGNMRPPTADLFGRLVTVPLAPRELVADVYLALIGTTAETTLIPAAANEFHDLTSIVIVNANGTTDVTVTIRSNTGAAPRFVLYAPLKATVGFTLPTPAPQAAVNTNWTAQCSASISGGALIFAQYLRNR